MSDFDHHMELMAAEVEMNGRPRTSPAPSAGSPVSGGGGGGGGGGNVMDFFKKPPAGSNNNKNNNKKTRGDAGEKSDTRSRREKRQAVLERHRMKAAYDDQDGDYTDPSSEDDGGPSHNAGGGKGAAKKPRGNKNESPEPYNNNSGNKKGGKPDKAAMVRTPEHTVHLKDLPFSCTRGALRAALDQFGLVEKVRVCEPKGSVHGESNVRTCYGFVQFSEIRAAERMKEVAAPTLPQEAIPADLPFRANPAKHVINDVHHSQDYNPQELGSASRFGNPKRDNKSHEALLPKKAAEMEEFLRTERERGGEGQQLPPSSKDLPSLPGTSSSSGPAPNQGGGGSATGGITLLERFRQSQSQDRDGGGEGINNRSSGGGAGIQSDLIPSLQQGGDQQQANAPAEFTAASSLLIDLVEKVSAWFGIEHYAKENKGAEPSPPGPEGDRSSIVTSVPATLKRITTSLSDHLEAEVNIFNQVLEGQLLDDEEGGGGEETIDLTVTDIVDLMNLTEIEFSQAIVAIVASAGKINKDYLSLLNSNGGDVIAAQKAAPRDRRLLRAHSENVLSIIRDRVRLVMDHTDPLNLDEALEEKSGQVSTEGRQEFFRRLVNSLLTLGMLLEFDLGSGLVSNCLYSHALVLLKTELSDVVVEQSSDKEASTAVVAAVTKEISNLEYCLGYNTSSGKTSSYFDRKYQAVDAEEAQARHTAVFGSYVLSQFLERNDEERKAKKSGTKTNSTVFTAPSVALPIIPAFHQ